ncbi:serine/threonine protein kinase [Corynebacterium heidelbergense]|uniref:non-specific serine/threonine protein kinase n=2 Tax=Corynebacterium heidelbergense TaxID=2055947 RepID=A0A364V6F2_9CORY|nr:serine/threonine protein kinase [Corynebacterium heidelbergense]
MCVRDRGGMGVVYRAWDDELDRPVAIKVITERALYTEGGRQRFRQEMRILARVHHHAIVSVHRAGQLENGLAFFQMDYIEGGNLAQLIANRSVNNDRLTASEAIHLLSPIAEALDYLHSAEKPIIHRDVKPGNILIPFEQGWGPASVLTDFGISLTEDETRMTSAGTIIGTDQYMAPELFAHGTFSEAPPVSSSSGADRYAFALVVLELLTLRPLRSVMSDEAWRFHRVFPGVSSNEIAPADAPAAAAISSVFTRALSNEPSDRHPTATAFLEDLARASAATAPSTFIPADELQKMEPPRSARPPVRPAGAQMAVPFAAPPKRRKWVRPLIAAGTVAGVALAAAVAYPTVIRPAWPAEARNMASEFPQVLPDRQHGTGWNNTKCQTAQLQPSERARILCTGNNTTLAAVDYGSGDWRNRAVGNTANATHMSNGTCAVDVMDVPGNALPTIAVLPEDALSRYAFLISGPQINKDQLTLPVC